METETCGSTETHVHSCLFKKSFKFEKIRNKEVYTHLLIRTKLSY